MPLGGNRLEPVGRSDRLLHVQALMGPVGVVMQHVGVDRGLRFLDAHKRAGGIEELAPQGAVETFHLAVLVR
jgi:hypothetical protein